MELSCLFFQQLSHLWSAATFSSFSVQSCMTTDKDNFCKLMRCIAPLYKAECHLWVPLNNIQDNNLLLFFFFPNVLTIRMYWYRESHMPIWWNQKLFLECIWVLLPSSWLNLNSVYAHSCKADLALPALKSTLVPTVLQSTIWKQVAAS